MTSDKIFMTISTLSRMAMGLVVFVILAHLLGPHSFGLIATAIAYCSLIALVADFGLTTFALREAGASVADARSIVQKALAVKGATTLLTGLAGLSVLLFVAPDAEYVWIYLFVFVGTTTASFGDLSFVAVRAVRRYDIEAYCVVGTSFVSLIMITAVTAVWTNPVVAALAFGTSRLVYLATSLFFLRPWLVEGGLEVGTVKSLFDFGRRSSPFALDGILSNLANQADVLMISLMLDPASVGIYQAGARLVQTISPFAVILATVYLPRLAHAHRHGDPVERKSLARQLVLEFSALSLVIFLGFLFAGPIVTTYVYGERFKPLIELWPAFATFAMLRLITAAYGIQLAAYSEMKLRISSLVISIVFLVLGLYFVIPSYGILGAAWVLAASSLISLVLYGYATARILKQVGQFAFVLAGWLLVAGFAVGWAWSHHG